MKPPDTSQKLIILSVGIATANNVVANLRKSGKRTPAPRIVVGGFAVTVGLLMFSEFQSELAEALAILIVVASLVGPNGTELVNLISKLTDASAPQRTGSVTSSTIVRT